VLPERVELSSVAALRAVLDRFDVGGRLRYISQFVWRGGGIELEVTRGAWYALRAEWPAAVLEQTPATDGLVRRRSPVVEGRWVRGTNGYALRVGIDLHVPTAMSIRAPGFGSEVPFVGRQPEQVEHALTAELTTYVHAFLDHHQPVPQAAAMDAERMQRLHVT
jgi:hypothetical protein